MRAAKYYGETSRQFYLDNRNASASVCNLINPKVTSQRRKSSNERCVKKLETVAMQIPSFDQEKSGRHFLATQVCAAYGISKHSDLTTHSFL